MPTGDSDARACSGCGSPAGDPCPECRAASATAPPPSTRPAPGLRRRGPEAVPEIVASRYRVGRLLGEGGFSVVHEAEDLRLGRVVALKLIRPDRDADVFDREARALARLQHPHVVTVFDAVSDGPWRGLAMERIEGQALAARLRSGALPWPEAVRMAAETAAGLEHAHSRGLVHGDVKPGNVLLDAAGRAKVTDFGTARAIAGATGSSMAFTVSYAAPEILDGARSTVSTDIYSLGMVMHEALCGRLPFAGSGTGFTARVSRDPPARLEGPAGLPAAVEAIVLACLARDPSMRPARALDVETALRAALEPEAGAAASVPSDLRASSLRHASAGERRRVVLLAVALRHLDDLDEECPPEEASQVRAEHVGAVHDLARRHRALVQESGSAHLTLLFGLPRRDEHDAQRAVACATAIVAALEGRPLAPRIACALHAVHATSSGPQQPWIVRRDEQRVTDALLAMAADSEIMATQAVVDACRGRHGFEPAGTVRDGRRGGETIAVHRAGPLPGSAALPLVGRTAELGLALDWAASAAEHGGLVIGIQGEAGMGKSRLAEEILERLTAPGDVAGVTVDAPPHAGEGPPSLVARMVRALGEAGLLDRALEPLTEADRAALAARLPAEMGARERDVAVRLACVRLLESLARAGRVALVVEDLHWQEASDAELLAHLVEATQSSPVLWIVTHRPEYQPPWASRPFHRPLVLGAMSASHERELIETFLGGALPPGLDVLVRGRSDGLPLHSLELVRSLLDRGLLQRASDGAIVVSADALVGCPPSVEAIIASRLDRLSPDAKRLLQVTALLGRDADLDVAIEASVLAAAAEPARAPAPSAADELLARDMLALRAAGGRRRARFRHALIHDVVLGTLIRSRERALHGAVADAFAAAAHLTEDERDAEVGRHRALSDEPQRAIPHLTRAVEHLVRAGELRAALPLASTLVSVCEAAKEPDGRALAEARLQAADLRSHLEDPDRGAELASLVIEHAVATADAELEARARLVAATCHAERRAHADAIDELRRAHERAAACGSAHLSAVALARQVDPLMTLGRTEEAESAVRDIESLSVEDAEPRLLAWEAHARSLYNRGRYGQCLSRIDEALALATSEGEPMIGARLLMLSCPPLVALGRHDEALRNAEEALRRFRGLQLRKYEAYMLAFLAHLSQQLGQARSAEAHARESVELARSLSASLDLALALRTHGFALHDLGRHAEALEDIESSLRLARAAGAARYETAGLLALGLVQCTLGVPEACASIERAAQLAASQGDLLRAAEADELRLRAWRLTGRAHDALATLDDVIARVRGQEGVELAGILVEAARVAADAGQQRRARELAREACALLEGSGREPDLIRARIALARAAVHDHPEEAMAAAKLAVEQSALLELHELGWESEAALGLAMMAAGRDEARTVLECASRRVSRLASALPDDLVRSYGTRLDRAALAAIVQGARPD